MLRRLFPGGYRPFGLLAALSLAALGSCGDDGPARPSVAVQTGGSGEADAGAAAEAGQQESLQLALYRAAVLATAMQRTADAKAWLERLISLAPEFKDAGERLKNLTA